MKPTYIVAISVLTGLLVMAAPLAYLAQQNATLQAKQSQVYTVVRTTTMNTQDPIIAAQLAALAVHANLGYNSTLHAPQPFSWNNTGGGILGFSSGPYTISGWAGVLTFVVTHPSPVDSRLMIRVTWFAHGVNYSSSATINGAGSASFPVLPCDDLVFTFTGLGNGYHAVTLATYWSD